MARDFNNSIDSPAGGDDRKFFYGNYELDPLTNPGTPRSPHHHNDDPHKDEQPRKDCDCCDSFWACTTSPWSDTSTGRSRQGGCTSFFIWALFSSFFWAVLWSLATSLPMAHEIHLLPGETWELSVPPLWSRTSLSFKTTTVDPGMEVYEFSPTMDDERAKCPLPTMPLAKNYKSTKNITLQGVLDYQYDFFQLNLGSLLTVDLRQHTGSVNIYLLQGYKELNKLQQLQSPSTTQLQSREMDSTAGTVYHDFRASSILKRFSGKGGQTTFTYQIQDQADFFIVVYENARLGDDMTKSQLIVNLEIQMTTHLLPTGRMICTALETSTGDCEWVFRSDHDRSNLARSCIIARAISTEMDMDPPQGEHDTPTMAPAYTDISQVPVVQATMVAPVGSPMLLIIAGLPLWIALIFILHTCGSKFWLLICGGGRGGAATVATSSQSSSWGLASHDQYEQVSTKGEGDRPDSIDMNKILSYQHA